MGDVISRRRLRLHGTERTLELFKKLAELGALELSQVLDKLSQMKPEIQDAMEATRGGENIFPQ